MQHLLRERRVSKDKNVQYLKVQVGLGLGLCCQIHSLHLSRVNAKSSQGLDCLGPRFDLFPH